MILSGRQVSKPQAIQQTSKYLGKLEAYTQQNLFILYCEICLTRIELKSKSEDENFELSNHTVKFQVLITKIHTSNIPSSLLRACGIRLHLIMSFRRKKNIRTTSYTTGTHILREMRGIHQTNTFSSVYYENSFLFLFFYNMKYIMSHK